MIRLPPRPAAAFTALPGGASVVLSGCHGNESGPPDQEEALRVADIWRAVRALPDKQRDAVMLLHAEGLSQAQAAQVMGCKEVTVAWHIHKARKTLRGVL